MPSEDAKRMKEPFLLFLDLITEYRIDTFLGKTGLTYIPQSKLDEIPGLELETYIKVLVKDKVLETIQKDDDALLWDKIDDNEGLKIIVDCMKSAEEIRVYKNSLNLKDGWASVRIDPPLVRGSTRYKMFKGGIVDKVVNLSQREGKLMEYLKNEDNRNKARMMIADELSLTESQISNLRSNLRRKLRKLNFSEESISEMLPTYQR